MELPKEVRDFLSATGRKGGQKKVPKGFAKMDPDRLKKVTRKGQKASLKVRKAQAVKRGLSKKVTLTPRPEIKEKQRGRRKDNTSGTDTVPKS